jgi:hypothetical protein
MALVYVVVSDKWAKLHKKARWKKRLRYRDFISVRGRFHGQRQGRWGPTRAGPQADLNLCIKTFLNGQLVSNIVLATSTEATDTIDYVATDQSGLTSTSTHTVIIEPMVVPPATSPSGAVTASSTEAKSSAQ